MGILEVSCWRSGSARGSGAARRTAERHEGARARDEPDIADLVDERHEAREGGDRRRAVVRVGALERLKPAQVPVERAQDGWFLPARSPEPRGPARLAGRGPARCGATGPSRRAAHTRVVSPPLSRRIRSAPPLWPPGRAAMARSLALTAPARVPLLAPRP